MFASTHVTFCLQVEKTFPRPIERWAIQDANYALGKNKHKKGEKKVILPVDKVHPLLKVSHSSRGNLLHLLVTPKVINLHLFGIFLHFMSYLGVTLSLNYIHHLMCVRIATNFF